VLSFTFYSDFTASHDADGSIDLPIELDEDTRKVNEQVTLPLYSPVSAIVLYVNQNTDACDQTLFSLLQITCETENEKNMTDGR